jgi:hypothetical protein
VLAGPGATKHLSAIDLRFANTRAVVHNNLCEQHHPAIGFRPCGDAQPRRRLGRDFVDVAHLDFHLRPGSKAIDAGLVLKDGGRGSTERRGGRGQISGQTKLRDDA